MRPPGGASGDSEWVPSSLLQMFPRLSSRSAVECMHIRLYHRDQPGRHDRLRRVMHRRADPDRHQHRREADGAASMILPTSPYMPSQVAGTSSEMPSPPLPRSSGCGSRHFRPGHFQAMPFQRTIRRFPPGLAHALRGLMAATPYGLLPGPGFWAVHPAFQAAPLPGHDQRLAAAGISPDCPGALRTAVAATASRASPNPGREPGLGLVTRV